MFDLVSHGEISRRSCAAGRPAALSRVARASARHGIDSWRCGRATLDDPILRWLEALVRRSSRCSGRYRMLKSLWRKE